MSEPDSTEPAVPKRKVPKALKVLAVIAGLWLIYRFIEPNGFDWADLKWTESVQLASGETIQIRRHVRFQQYRIFGLGGAWSGKQIKTSSINLVSKSADFVLWDAPLIPIYMDRDTVSNEWIIVAAEDGGELRAANGAPCPYKWAFRLRQGRWHVQPVPVAFLERKSNLLIDFRIHDDRRLIAPRLQWIVEKRKDEQLSLPPRIPLSWHVVGRYNSVPEENYCKRFSGPVFTQDFVFGTPSSAIADKFSRVIP